MGLALYGRTFRLANSNNNQIGAPAVGPGFIFYFLLMDSTKNSFFRFRWFIYK
jgi:hypothetical protein